MRHHHLAARQRPDERRENCGCLEGVGGILVVIRLTSDVTLPRHADEACPRTALSQPLEDLGAPADGTGLCDVDAMYEDDRLPECLIVWHIMRNAAPGLHRGRNGLAAHRTQVDPAHHVSHLRNLQRHLLAQQDVIAPPDLQNKRTPGGGEALQEQNALPRIGANGTKDGLRNRLTFIRNPEHRPHQQAWRTVPPVDDIPRSQKPVRLRRNKVRPDPVDRSVGMPQNKR